MAEPVTLPGVFQASTLPTRSPQGPRVLTPVHFQFNLESQWRVGQGLWDRSEERRTEGQDAV